MNPHGVKMYLEKILRYLGRYATTRNKVRHSGYTIRLGASGGSSFVDLSVCRRFSACGKVVYLIEPGKGLQDKLGAVNENIRLFRGQAMLEGEGAFRPLKHFQERVPRDRAGVRPWHEKHRQPR